MKQQDSWLFRKMGEQVGSEINFFIFHRQLFTNLVAVTVNRPLGEMKKLGDLL